VTGIAESAADSRPAALWRVRAAEPSDAERIAAAVGELLRELGANPPPTEEMQVAARELIDDHDAAALLIVESGAELLGVLTASWLSAIHIPGRYGLIQDLWVKPSARGHAAGAKLLLALVERARELAVERIEVGLPREAFAGLGATEAFYRANGFTQLGPRMRLVLA
jgi:GNAT superfamily N-acetyltransferase